MMKQPYIYLLAMWVLLGFAAPARAFNQEVAMESWRIIAAVETRHGIPRGLLHSMSLVETGRGLEGLILPWPYAVGVNRTSDESFATVAAAKEKITQLSALGFSRFNVSVAGKSYQNMAVSDSLLLLDKNPNATKIVLSGNTFGKSLETQKDAVAFVQRLLKAGYKNVDIGLMQVNWLYHGQHFGSVAEAFEPYANLNYAVNYLRQHRESRDWWGSVGRYHSGTPRYATKYIQNVWEMYQRVHRIQPQKVTNVAMAANQ